MATTQAEEIRGKTMRWKWTEGPTKGSTHEHVFHKDGTVEYHGVEGAEKSEPTEGNKKEEPAKKRPEYGAMKVADDIYAVSYLTAEGYTITAVLNFMDHNIVGYASNAKEWYPVRGTFEVVK